MWKNFKNQIIRNENIRKLLNMTDYYNNKVSIKDKMLNIPTTDIYLIKKDDILIFAVKKDDWKKYIGIHRTWLMDMSGNEFSNDTFFKIQYYTNAKDKEFYTVIPTNKKDIPTDLIESMYDELIENIMLIRIELEKLIHEEFYE